MSVVEAGAGGSMPTAMRAGRVFCPDASETSDVAALNADPDDRSSGMPTGWAAYTLTISNRMAMTMRRPAEKRSGTPATPQV